MDVFSNDIPIPKLGNASCEIIPQRADVPRVIREEAQARLGRMAVVGWSLVILSSDIVCGPGGMADQARKAVVDNIEHEKGEIEYFEEAFTW